MKTFEKGRRLYCFRQENGWKLKTTEKSRFYCFHVVLFYFHFVKLKRRYELVSNRTDLIWIVIQMIFENRRKVTILLRFLWAIFLFLFFFVNAVNGELIIATETWFGRSWSRRNWKTHLDYFPVENSVCLMTKTGRQFSKWLAEQCQFQFITRNHQ